MRTRLLLSYLTLVLVVLLVLEIPLGVLFARHEHSALTNEAADEASGLAVLATESVQHGQTAGLRDLVDRFHQAGGSEVLIALPGRAVVDSDGDGAVDAVALRDAIAAATAGRSVTGSFHDEGAPFTYAAVPIHTEGTGDTPQATVVGAVVLMVPAASAFGRVRTVWLLLVAFGAAVLLLAAGIGARLAAGLNRPIAGLEEAVASLGEGDLSARATPHGPPELRALAAQFNAMAAQLERLVSAQARFVADASHQLRSPLTALRLRLENLESALDGDAADSVAAANREVQRLSHLVDGLLVLSRADEERPERKPVDVPAVITERVEAWAALADERGVDLEAAPGRLRDQAVPLVPGDLEQILDNLLANALDASPAGRSIVVETSEADGAVRVAVDDEGVGMDPADLDRAFDRFWQGTENRNGSSGLGLAIVRQLAARNDASVELLASTRRPPPPGRRPGVRATVTFSR